MYTNFKCGYVVFVYNEEIEPLYIFELENDVMIQDPIVYINIKIFIIHDIGWIVYIKGY